MVFGRDEIGLLPVVSDFTAALATLAEHRAGQEAGQAAGSLVASCPSVSWTSAALPPPFDAVLPRPAAPGADVHDAVAGILAEVRADGDAALVRCTAAFDGVDVIRRPAGPRGDDHGGGGPRRPRRPRGAGDGLRPDRRLPRRRGHGAGRPQRRGDHGPPPDAPGGAGRPLRAGRARPLSLDRPHVRRARTRGGRREPRALRAPGGRRHGGRRHAVRGAGRRRRRGLPGGRRPGHRRPGLRHRLDPTPSTSSPGPATPTSRRRSARCRASSAWPPPSPDPPRSSWSPDRRPTPRSPPSTWWSRPSTDPTAWPGW